MTSEPNKKLIPLPTIRQTKTSIFRMLKANPLLNRADLEVKSNEPTTRKVDKVRKPTNFTRSQSVRVTKNTDKPANTRIRRIVPVQENAPPPNPTMNEKPEGNRKVVFQTSTPMSEKTLFHHYRSDIFKMTPECTKVDDDLCQHLIEWLITKRKSYNSFKHLQNFASNASGFDVDNKENIEPFCIYRTNSYENLNIPNGGAALTPITKVECDLNKFACDALTDLRDLLMQGYPVMRCEAWLKLIYNKCQSIEKDPEYWECRALIEQSRDNITAAVEHYRTAIIHGADVNLVDHSLEDLLQKFSLLNIAGEVKLNRNKKRSKILNDARNIFKSSIIHAAVQERNLKKKEMLPDILGSPAQAGDSNN